MDKEIEVLCIKDVLDTWGTIDFVEGKVYRCEKKQWKIIKRISTINEDGGQHTLRFGNPMDRWFRKHFRVLHFGNVREKKEMLEQDAEILDAIIVALKLLSCSVEEQFNKGSRYKYTQVYTIKNEHDKTIFVNIQFNKKMKVKKISAILGFLGTRTEFSNLQEMYNFVISEF